MQQTSIIPLAQPASREAQTKTSIELLEFVNEARAEFGEAAIRHNDFLSRCKDELDGDLYETFVEPPRKTATGRIPAFEAITMTIDQCRLVAMRESKGVRRRVLARLNALKAQVAQQPPVALPQDYIEALEHLLAAKKSEKLAIEQRDAATSQLAIAAPKAQALDRIAQADGEKCISDAAKAMQMPPRKLFTWMDKNGWIFRRGNKWVAYQNKIHSGCLTHRVTLVELKNGATKEVDQVMVTPKGQTKLAEVAA